MQIGAGLQDARAIFGMEVFKPELQNIHTLLVRRYPTDIPKPAIDVHLALSEIHVVIREPGEVRSDLQAGLTGTQFVFALLACEHVGKDFGDALQTIHKLVWPVALFTQSVEGQGTDERL